ncbi:MAG: response regulator [Verrucomicrobia bacterium]|nr:response regulator [Verrucomicrobiota bacterium]
MKVLIVEDEKKIAAFVRKGLEAQGFIVDVTHHGDEGFTLATPRPYDAAILDIMRPGRDGLSILRNLRERKMALPVILLTARNELNERLEGLNLGADGYLAKPFHIEELIACLHQPHHSPAQRGRRPYGLYLTPLAEGPRSGAFRPGPGKSYETFYENCEMSDEAGSHRGHRAAPATGWQRLGGRRPCRDGSSPVTEASH